YIKEAFTILDEAKADFLKTYVEIEFNAEEDTLFARMLLVRLQQFSDLWFGTHLKQDVNDECKLWNEWLSHGLSEGQCRQNIRQKRIKDYGLTP
ncbi:MAG: hypothetical protein WC325_10625, partial [Candidatus Bathyarchaeia archaeon]